MKFETVLFIVLSVIIVVLTSVVITEYGVIRMLQADKIRMKYELTQIHTDNAKIREQLVEEEKLHKEKTELLERVRKASTFKEYIAVWKELNQ